MKPFQVKISPQLKNTIKDCLTELNVTPTPVTTGVKDEDGDTGAVSLLSHHVLDDFHPAKPTEAGVVTWSPPQQNWNCWTGCNIDEGMSSFPYLKEGNLIRNCPGKTN